MKPLGGKYQQETSKVPAGEEVSVVPDSMVRKLTGVNLKPTQRTLKGPTQGTLQGNASVGRSRSSAGHLCGQETSQATVGQPAIEALKLLVRVGTVADGTETQNPVQRFPQLFHSLGTNLGRLRYQSKGRGSPICLDYPRQSAYSLDVKCEGRTREHGETGRYLSHRHLHRLVRRDGSRS